jgi:hypothetical protein
MPHAVVLTGSACARQAGVIDGSKTTFNWASPMWTNTSLLSTTTEVSSAVRAAYRLLWCHGGAEVSLVSALTHTAESAPFTVQNFGMVQPVHCAAPRHDGGRHEHHPARHQMCEVTVGDWRLANAQSSAQARGSLPARHRCRRHSAPPTTVRGTAHIQRPHGSVSP